MLRRRLPLLRKAAIKRVLMARRARATGPSDEVVALVRKRAGYRCEIAGCPVGTRRGVDYHLHHRRPRAAGGTRRPDANEPPNLLLVCPPCHRDIESHRAVALASAWILHQYADPAMHAVLIRRDRWVYLTASGGYSEHPPVERP